MTPKKSKKYFKKSKFIDIKRRFKIGDKVRLKLKKKVFDKGDIVYYSKEAYMITDIKKDLNVNKYQLSNDKYYQGKDLMKVENIVYYDPDTNNDEEEERFEENRKIVLQNKKLKRVGVDKKNIIDDKRLPKPNTKWID